MNDMEKYRPFSTHIERESNTMPKHYFFLYFTPLILISIVPIFDVLLGTRGFILLTVASGTLIYSFKRISKEIKRIKATYYWTKAKATVKKSHC